MTHSVFWLTFINPVDPAVDLTTLEKYGRVEKITNASGAACYKFGYKENPDYDTFEAFEKTRRDFTVYSAVEGVEPGYSGLNVVCILHTAIQKAAPGNDSGFDIQAEYEEALKFM